MSENACKVSIPDGGRAVTFHTCGRPLSGSEDYPDLCGVHAAAKRRKAAKDRERIVADSLARDNVREADDRASTLSVALGVTVSAETRFDSAIRRHPTGNAVVKLDDLQKLADRVARLESMLRERDGE